MMNLYPKWFQISCNEKKMRITLLISKKRTKRDPTSGFCLRQSCFHPPSKKLLIITDGS